MTAPAPWKIGRDMFGGLHVYAQDGRRLTNDRRNGDGDWEPTALVLAASLEMQEALIHAEAILSYCPRISTNKGGKGPNTTTRVALNKVRAALAAVEPKEAAE